MKLKEITVTRGATINLGDFESTRIDISVTMNFDELDQGATLQGHHRELDDEVSRILIEECEKVKGSVRGKSPARFVRGA